MRDFTVLLAAAMTIAFTILAIGWVTILPSIGILYLAGYLP